MYEEKSVPSKFYFCNGWLLHSFRLVLNDTLSVRPAQATLSKNSSFILLSSTATILDILWRFQLIVYPPPLSLPYPLEWKLQTTARVLFYLLLYCQ